jgi:hypothetical protein
MKFKFKTLVALSAFLVAGCAAFFSVFGLSQLFAGASLAVIIMASSLEFAKIISVSFLQRYWVKISKTLRVYLSIGVIILVCITSAGIYGFLSNAYQKTATQYEIGENEQSALSHKKVLFQKNIDDNKAILATKSKRLDQLSSLRTNQENRLTQAQSNAERNRVRNDINGATKEIQALNAEIDVINTNINPFVDSVNAYENKIIESKSKNAGASEVGPLKYIATLVGQPMDKVVNWFILLLIFVFDPLAMALVIATNKIKGLEVEETKSESMFNLPKDIPLEIQEEFVIPTPRYDQPPNSQIVNPETAEIDLKHNTTQIDQEPLEVIDETVDENEELDYVTEQQIEELPITDDTEESIVTAGTITEIVEEQPVIEPEVKEEIVEEIKQEEPKTEPVVATGNVKLEDIKEIKAQNRGFSKEIPPPSHNTIQRIGNNKVYHKKRKQ